ncbi:MAG: HD domain-containing protein [Candidatus Caldatribacteriota bacterium]|nr:HD domain-containing protein [Candidatus Caldatribacteriota bacterium]
MIGQKTFFIFFIVALIMQFLFRVNIHVEIYLSLLGWLIYSYISQNIIKKRKIEFKLIKKIEFINYILCLIFITSIFYYSGSILWIGPIFFIFIILYASILTRPVEGIVITFLSFAFCSLIILLEYSGYIPHKGFFESSSYLYKDGQYIYSTIVMLGIQYFLIFIAGINFAKKLKQKNNELIDVKMELEKWNTNLEERVKLRTQELQKSKNQLSTLYHVSQTISSTLKLEDILQTILDFSIKISKASRGSIMLLDTEKRIFFIKIPFSKNEKNIDKIIFAENKNTIGWVVKHKKPLYIEDLENDKQFSKIKIIRRKIKQLLIIPIIIEDKVKGVINLENTNINTEIVNLLKSFSEGAAVAINNAQLYQKIQDSYFEIIKALAQAIEAKDPYTHGHSIRVMEYANLITQKLDLPVKDKESIKFAAVLHDIGKIGISEIVLNNSDKLISEQYNEIKQHPIIGQNIIQPIELLEPIQPLIRHHHEWFNGNGYPDGLSRENIPFGARILAVVDAYDAMKSDRPYRKSLSEERAIQELKHGSGSQFDPDLVKIFLEILKEKVK